jgi:ribonuclease HI
MPRLVENALLIYTDGSLFPKGRKGGYGIVLVHVNQIGEERVVLEDAPPGISGSTGNRMELQACIEGLQLAPSADCFSGIDKVVVRTDSRYLRDNYVRALGSWRSAGWKNAQGRPVDNADLWKDFVRAYGKVHKRVTIEWVKGHAKGKLKDPYNARADKLAKESAKSPLSTKVFRSSVRRKLSDTKTKPGSVSLNGQVLTIFIVEVQRLRVQKTWKYRYQVVSRDSSDYDAIDWAYSQGIMRDGHYYEVQMNSDMAHPQIVSTLREIDANELSA